MIAISPQFNLAVTGFIYFTRFGRVLDQRSIARDPLSGVVDGTNKFFYTNYFPILTSGSLTVYTGATQVGGSADYNSGEITLTTAPTVQPTASYTFTPYTSDQILSFLIAGFDEMELRWQRGWQLSDGLGGIATESSGSIYVTDSSGSEPICGNTYFYNNRVQVAFLMKCTEYRFQLTQLTSAAQSNYYLRETGRGLTVDKTKVPQNLATSIEALERNLDLALIQVQENYYTDGSQYGGVLLEPATAGYMGSFEWQQESLAMDYKGSLGYQFGYRPLNYPLT